MASAENRLRGVSPFLLSRFVSLGSQDLKSETRVHISQSSLHPSTDKNTLTHFLGLDRRLVRDTMIVQFGSIDVKVTLLGTLEREIAPSTLQK